MSTRARIVVGLSLVVALANVSVAAPSPQLVQAAVSQLLEAYWSSFPAARQEAEQFYQELPTELQEDPLVNYTYAVLQLKQRRYAEAQQHLEDLLRKHPDHLRARQLRVYIALLMREYPIALAELRELGQRLESAELAEDEAVELASFLGRSFGYLQGPAAGEAPGARVRDIHRDVLARQQESLQLALEEARQAVLERYEELLSRRDAVEVKAEEEAAKEREETEEDLKEQRKLIDEQRDAAFARREELNKELESQLDQLSRADQPLADQLVGLNHSLGTVNRRLLAAYEQIAYLQHLFRDEEDPLRRREIEFEIIYWQRLAAQYSADVRALRDQMGLVARQRTALQQQAGAVRAEHARGTKEIGDQLAQLERRERRTDIEERRLDRRRPRSHQLLGLSARAGAYTTYETFSVDAEKKRLLDEVQP